jgi:hypothetical protein
MAPIQGMRGTGEFSSDFRPKNYRELFTLLEPNGNAPLNAMLAMGSSEPTDDPEYKNFRDELPDRTMTVNGAVASTSTASITIDAADDNKFAIKGAQQLQLLLLLVTLVVLHIRLQIMLYCLWQDMPQLKVQHHQQQSHLMLQ